MTSIASRLTLPKLNLDTSITGLQDSGAPQNNIVQNHLNIALFFFIVNIKLRYIYFLLKYCNIRYVFFILCGNKDYLDY